MNTIVLCLFLGFGAQVKSLPPHKRFGEQQRICSQCYQCSQSLQSLQASNMGKPTVDTLDIAEANQCSWLRGVNREPHLDRAWGSSLFHSMLSISTFFSIRPHVRLSVSFYVSRRSSLSVTLQILAHLSHLHTSLTQPGTSLFNSSSCERCYLVV